MEGPTIDHTVFLSKDVPVEDDCGWNTVVVYTGNQFYKKENNWHP